jgi:hypothetical protein
MMLSGPLPRSTNNARGLPLSTSRPTHPQRHHVARDGLDRFQIDPFGHRSLDH